VVRRDIVLVFFVWDGLSLTVLAFLATQDGGLTDSSTVRAFYDVYNGIVMPGAFGFVAAIFLTSVGLAMVRRVFAARWVGYLSQPLYAAPAAEHAATAGMKTCIDCGETKPESGFLPSETRAEALSLHPETRAAEVARASRNQQARKLRRRQQASASVAD
jgi:hypothetical protein